MQKAKLVVRTCGGNPNHHLWNNNGTWWVHFTVHLPDYTKQRVRRSLRTKSVAEARRRRDALFRNLRFGMPGTTGPEPLALAA